MCRRHRTAHITSVCGLLLGGSTRHATARRPRSSTTGSIGNGPAQNRVAAEGQTRLAHFVRLSGLDVRTPVAGWAAVVGDGEDMGYIVSEQAHDMVRKPAYVRADTGAQGSRELQEGRPLTAASGPPIGLPRRAPQRTRAPTFAWRCSYQRVASLRSADASVQTGPGGSTGQFIGDALANGLRVLFGYLARQAALGT
jgi:hypothetical protein